MKDGPKAPAGRRASIQKPKPVADMQPDSTDALPMQSNPMMQRSARRQSVRESVLEDTLSSVVPSAPIPTGASATTPTDSNRRADEKLLQQLQDEREQMERMKLQVNYSCHLLVLCFDVRWWNR